MVQQSIGGRRREPYHHPRADGPDLSQKAGFLPNHTTNGSGPRIHGGELGSRYPRNPRNLTQNHKIKNNFNNRNSNHQGGRNFYPDGNQAAGLPRFPQSRNANETYWPGNNFHGRGSPSGPRAYQGLDQGYNPDYRPGRDRGPQQYLQNQHGPRQTGYQAPGHHTNQQSDDSNQGPSRRRRGGRNRRKKQNQQLPLSLPLRTPVISHYDVIDDLELFDEPIEPFVPILGSDGMYYDRDGDIIIEDAPEVDIVQIVTEGTIEMAKITQSLLESITKFG